MYQQLIASDTIFFFQCDAILKKSEGMSNKLLKKSANCGAIAGPMGPQWVHNGSLLFILYNYKKKYLISRLSCLVSLVLAYQNPSKAFVALSSRLRPSWNFSGSSTMSAVSRESESTSFSSARFSSIFMPRFENSDPIRVPFVTLSSCEMVSISNDRSSFLALGLPWGLLWGFLLACACAGVFGSLLWGVRMRFCGVSSSIMSS